MDASSSNRRGQPCGVWLCGLIVFMVGYLASPGPVVWLVNRDCISSATYDRLFETVYAPLVWVEMNTDFFFDNPVGVAYADYVESFDR